MKLLTVVLISILFSYAVHQGENQVDEVSSVRSKDENFPLFVKKIPAYDFPVGMSCDFERPAAEVNFEGYERYFPEGGRIIAKLRSNTDFRFVIFDFPCDYSCPTLFSYSKDGKRIDSLNLTPGQCSEDAGMIRKEWFKIDENIHVELIDTTHYFSYIDGTQVRDSSIVHSRHYLNHNLGGFYLIHQTRVFIP